MAVYEKPSLASTVGFLVSFPDFKPISAHYFLSYALQAGLFLRMFNHGVHLYIYDFPSFREKQISVGRPAVRYLPTSGFPDFMVQCKV